ncbi:triacylglycerol lipase [Rivularia sp. PCC 7116]|uniref:esterase/lipase family protein n=1 Tax=Rivularia sp. PCC 7116 TaxID=373994 RepID=UPI0005C7A754|nr:triacylglycerol lipase [Rivularia sp. PCC 7116]
MTQTPRQRNPVLLVHGIWDTGKVFRKMISFLNEAGWKVYDLDLTPNDGRKGLDELALQVADKVEATFGEEQPFDLLGFSMGGIVSRYYVQRLGGINRVQRFIALSAPSHGTLTGYFNQGLGCVQMRPNSSLIRDLNSDADMLSQINFTSIWTPYDMMIVPADSSKMPVGDNLTVPVLVHAWMLVDKRSLSAIATALSAPVNS